MSEDSTFPTYDVRECRGHWHITVGDEDIRCAGKPLSESEAREVAARRNAGETWEAIERDLAPAPRREDAPEPKTIDLMKVLTDSLARREDAAGARVAQIAARLKAATPGPWVAVDYNRERPERDTWLGVIQGAFEIATPRYEIGHVKYSALPHEENVANAAFIAHSRSDIEYLLAALSTAEREREAARSDTERLDWMQAYTACVGHYRATNKWWSRAGGSFNTLREAIDAAMRKP